MLTAQSSIILIVDDQPTNLKMLFSFLQESGYKVLVAKRGESALKKLEKISPDLILLDVMMPDIDGFETCQRLKASTQSQDIPVIFMTALCESLDKIKGLKVGAVDYITKPFQKEEVLARIENQLKIRKLSKQLEEQNQQLQKEIRTRRKIEERLELVIRAVNDGFWDWNLESGEIYFSPRWKEMLGYSDEELPNELATWENLIFPEDRIPAFQLTQNYNSSKIYRFESKQRFRHKDGSTIHILTRALHLKDESGQVIRLIGASTDITEMTKATEALQQSQLLLAGVLNSSLDGVAAMSTLRDSQGQIIDFKWLLLNPAAEKMLGWTHNQLVGKQMLMKMPGMRKTGLFEKFVRVVETGEPLETELYYADENIQAWLQIVAVKLGDGFAVTYRDITERKQAEAALKESVARFQGIFENAAIGIGLTGATGRLIMANPTLEAFLGYSEAEMRCQDFTDITYPDDRACDIKLTQEVIDGVRDSFQIEKRYIRKDGEIFWGRLTVSAVRNPRGEFQFTVAILQDITERKKVEERLRLLEKVVVNANDAVIISEAEPIDCPGPRIIYVNEAFTRMTGYCPEEVIGKTPRILQGAKTDRKQLDKIRHALETWQSVRVELINYRKDGSEFWVELEIVPVADERGWFTHWVSVQRDITERKLAEERLRLLERAIAASNNGIIITDAQTPGNPIIYVNSGLERMTGYRTEDIIGSQCCPFDQTYATPTVLEQLRCAICEGRETQVTLRSCRIDGTFFWSEFCITPVRDAQGCLTHFIGVQTDISDRKQVEEALRISEERLQFAIEGSGMGLWDWNLSTGQMYFDPQWKMMLGYEVEEIENSFLSWERLIHPQDLPSAIEAINAHFEGRTPIYKVEVRMLSKSGEWKWILSQAKVMERDVSGRSVRMTGTHLDITDAYRQATQRKQALEELKKSEERWQLITKGTNDGIWDLNLKTNQTFRSSRWKEMLGYEDHELGTNNDEWVTRIHPDDLERAMQVKQDYLERKIPKYAVEFRLRCKDGTYKWILGRGQAVWDEAGQPVRMVGSNTDISDRKRVEDALRQSEARLQKLAANVPGMLFEFVRRTDNSYHFAYVSSGCREINELEPEQLLEDAALGFEIVHPDDAQRLYESINISAQILEPWVWEGRIITPSGKLKWVQGAARPELCGNGDILWHGLVIDVSDRVLVQESLRESEERFRIMADSTAVLLWLSGTDGQGTFFNKTWLDFTGRTLEEELGSGWLDNVHPEDRQRSRETYLKAFEVRENFEMEYRLLRFDGEYRWIVDLGKPRFTPNGSFAGYIGSCLDITERKQAEIEITLAKTALERQIQRALLLGQITQEIRSSLKPEEIFQTAATQIGQAFSVNRCLIHTYIDLPIPRIPFVADYKQPGIESIPRLEIPVIDNPHAQLLLTQDSAIASDDVYADPLLEAVSAICQQLGLKSMLVVRTSYQGKPNGAIALHQYDRYRQWTESEIELLESVAAQLGIAIAQANLLEQEKQRRQELALQNQALEKAKHEAEAANRAKSQFLSKMSHELRTPLNAILGFTQVMARDKSLKTEQLEYLGIINRSGEHLLDLINDILSMSKIEAGQVTFNENRFDLYCLLDSLEEMLRLKATSKGLQLIFERTPDVPQYVQTDESKLRQVLINLLGNAIKFTQAGTVTLQVRGKNRESAVASREENHSTPYSLLPTPYSLFFEVSDTGPGIAHDELETIFDPFVQTETGRQSMEGTGLGLPISQQFVRMMGGNITVSSSLGQGAIFTFDIQVGMATSADKKPISSQRRVISLEPNQSPYRILVIEDVAENRQLLVEMLKVLGFEVRTATNGQEGVALWESWSPHLICMDMLMPVMDGYEATQQIKQTSNGQDTVIIALTASAFEEQREAILRSGCDDFLPKPFQQEELLQKIGHYLGVRYLYEEQQLPTLPQPPDSEAPLIPEALAIMPAPWITQLHQAALYADDELINQLIQQIPLEHGSLSRALREMLNNFRLEELINLTESAKSFEG
jgi:PAS domain S-box-containing protein